MMFIQAFLFVLSVNAGMENVHTCADERWWFWDDNTCTCPYRWVRIGRDGTWSDWQEQTSDSVACHTDNLGDPQPGTHKECQCGRLSNCDNTWEGCVQAVTNSLGVPTTCQEIIDGRQGVTLEEACQNRIAPLVECGGDPSGGEQGIPTMAELCPDSCNVCPGGEADVGSKSSESVVMDLQELMMKTEEVSVASNLPLEATEVSVSVGEVYDVFDCAWEKWWWWDSNTCKCPTRYVRIGRDDTFSEWQEQTSDEVPCHTDNLGDPIPRTHKKCQCGRVSNCENTWDACIQRIGDRHGVPMSCQSLINGRDQSLEVACAGKVPIFAECGGDPSGGEAGIPTMAELCPDSCMVCPTSGKATQSLEALQSSAMAGSVSAVSVPEVAVGGLALVGLFTIGYLAYRSCRKQTGDYVNVVDNQEV